VPVPVPVLVLVLVLVRLVEEAGRSAPPRATTPARLVVVALPAAALRAAAALWAPMRPVAAALAVPAAMARCLTWQRGVAMVSAGDLAIIVATTLLQGLMRRSVLPTPASRTA
jgi:hypothetical protein